MGLPFFLSVHDELAYNLQAFPYRERAVRHLETVWRDADARFVISEAMGEEYNRRYGTRPFSIVTDGVRDVAAAPAARPAHRLRVYFMGSVHLAYEANFHALIHALERLQAQAPALEVSFTLRGGCPFDLPDTSVPVTRLGWGTQADVERDMADADLLYFPLPFEEEFEAFVRYSLSTKMVSYLGSGLPILFHGPSVSAAGTLLSTHDAGLLAPTLCPDALAETLSTPRASLDARTRNALRLADAQFRIEEQRHRFWTPILDAMPAAPDPLTPAAC
jgi:glycosyltransferase involved in cell wall biosynthesis